MAGPKKTARAPASSEAPRYRIKDGAPKHYISGRLVGAGAVVTLESGVEPGDWLELIGAPKAEKVEETKTPAKGTKAE